MSEIKRIIVLGGGTAGWLTAGLIAAQHSNKSASAPLDITVIESDTVGTVGVGEGTWPTMRRTLAKIGISEQSLFRDANAAFKQASKFVDWHTHDGTNFYYHPFSAPQGSAQLDISPYWADSQSAEKYAFAVNYQASLCEQGLGPKELHQPDFSAIANYGYHLDAGMFIGVLREHCVTQLGVAHRVDHVERVDGDGENGLHSLTLKSGETLAADLFIDCSGFNSVLLAQTLKVPLVDCSQYLLADRALVTQVPHANETTPIKPYTQSTAQEAGWIWDIGLQHRRGIGYVYSSRYCSHEQAKASLLAYTEQDAFSTEPREIAFTTGYREQFWVKNCVAVGLASGFLEPLEASALMLIEQSANFIAEQLPANSHVMPLVAKRFNQSMTYQWERTIEFLKLHYVLSNRKEAFWQANKNSQTIPKRLAELLQEWQYRPPLDSDFLASSEVFSAQSYRYILYGMRAQCDYASYARSMTQRDFANRQLELNHMLGQQLSQKLPPHRALIEHIIKR